MRILNSSNHEITLQEALHLLEEQDKFSDIERLVQDIVQKTGLHGSAYSDDYEDQIQAHNKHVFSDSDINDLLLSESKTLVLESNGTKTQPEIGDIAYLKIKLRNTSFDKKKNIFNGFERRPVLIISVDSSKVDTLELTHAKWFGGMPLISVGRLDKNDIRESFLNIYTHDDYKQLDYEYNFPLEFKNGIPKTKYELQKERFGKIYKVKDGDEPFIVKFDYSKNYITKLSDEQTNKIINTLNEYIEKTKQEK